MKRLKILSILLAALMILPGCTSGETNPAKKTDSKTKEADLVLSPGVWDCTASDPFQCEDLEGAFATRRFSAEELPEGSVLRVADGLVCTVSGWSSYPAPEKEARLVTDGKETEVQLTSEVWGKATSLAFSVTAKEGKLTAEQAEAGLSVRVPATAPDRRTFSWNDDETLAILTVGNSFSDDAMEYVYDIAKSAGVKNVVLGNLYFGSCRVEWHYNYWTQNQRAYEYRFNNNGKWVTAYNSSFEAAFDGIPWDYISFQQCAQEIQTDASLYTHLADLLAMARERCPEAKFVWHQPWANRHANYDMSVKFMYLDCLAAARKIAEPYGFDEVITTCTAIQNLRTSFVDNDSRILRDGWHLSYDLGRYTAGLTFFSQLTGIDISDMTFAPSGVSQDEKAAAIESAANAACRPRIVTPSVYTQDPLKERLEHLDSDYELLNVPLSVGYWYATSSQTCDVDSDFAKGFRRSELFTKETLPAGSVIIVEEGYKCRPDGWREYPTPLPEVERAPFLATGSGTTFQVPEDWFDVYTTRGFNLSVADGSGKTVDSIDSAMRIYIPKK